MVADCERAISRARERVSSQSWVERKVLLLLLVEESAGVGGFLLLVLGEEWE